MSKTAVSKVIMACKLHEVQKNLMGKKFESLTLDHILPLIFKECNKQNMTFWFNFLEEACVLNLRDTRHENYELNIRYAYENAPINIEKINKYKLILLINTFLITSNPIDVVASSAKKEKTNKQENKPIQESNLVPPRAIRAAMDTIKGRGDKVTKKAIEHELQLDKMSIDNRRQCIAYLKDMKE